MGGKSYILSLRGITFKTTQQSDSHRIVSSTPERPGGRRQTAIVLKLIKNHLSATSIRKADGIHIPLRIFREHPAVMKACGCLRSASGALAAWV
jgi:hypothetical protein